MEGSRKDLVFIKVLRAVGLVLVHTIRQLNAFV